MKVSNYNILIPINNGFLLIFNSISGNFLKMDKDAANLYMNMKNKKDDFSRYKGYNDDLAIMQKSGVILEDNINEFELINVQHNLRRFLTSSMNLTIAPTLNCNFNCFYCFENKKKSRMTKKTEEKLIEFIKSKIKNLSYLKIEWFGGEPLLEKNIIYNLSEKIISLCKKNDCKFSASMITNGYLLDKKTALRLKKLKVDRIQITLDGPKEIHDKRRMLVNGSGTFDKIVENLINCADIIKIDLRINVDKKNKDEVHGLIDLLKQKNLEDKINVYYGMVTDDTSSCKDFSENTFNTREYLSLETKLFNYNIKKGFKVFKKPKPAIGGCSAVSINSFIIDPKGDLYKCAKTIGIKEEKVGNIADPIKLNSKHLKWLSWDPKFFDICRNCKYLPLCMGGCPFEYIKRGLNKPDKCSEWNKNFDDMLKLYYKSNFQ